ncbi:MAG TPA: hypothetical protein VGF38_08825 [Ktedonobacterales bacterium]|jgi:hypothetical protein
MMNDTYSGGPSSDNYGVDGPPPVLPREDEERRGREIPAYGGEPRERHRPPSYVRWIAGLLIVFVALALACGGIGAVLAAIAFNSTPASATVDKTFSVTGVPTLMIDSAAGSVHINRGTDGQITLHATKRVRALTHSQAQSALDAITITTTQSGNQVTIQEDNTDAGGWFFNGFQRAQIDLIVTAPANTNLDVSENAGTLTASGFTGQLVAHVNAGSATLSSVTMAKGSSLSVNAGSLTVDGALQPGASLFVEVSAGSADVTLPQDTSAHLDASASAGSLNVNGWNIAENHNAANTTASGDLNPNPTGTITIRVNAGSASLNAG